MSDPLDIRRKRLKFRAWHRGSREADLMIGPFADRYVQGFDAPQLDRFEHLLDLEDPDVYDWMIGRTPIPPELDGDVARLLVAFCREGGGRNSLGVGV